ncbi:chromosomal replication initiator protein DnaA [Gimesia chilikensis]|uniref:chromosomal replication initiator protein DnaA n=1 Tax=Gimesia chilikensis TaxID=2605989 RepID=UPI000C45F07B|nr:chromosomal replication initiator protein DnaA [Gimesia chilikensis]MBN72307.1 chromosomal replication initiator protein DnaA [Gimesia sp.]MCR9231872.1 chromosomal replication initiator protein DnaA [bacterium]QDT83290.1 Chromosomal replication initiator protein DnaA [Gimesia chilikensis]
MQPTSLAVEGTFCDSANRPTEAKLGPATTGSEEQSIYRLLAQQVGERGFQNWFAGKVRLKLDGNLLIVGVASPFLLTWMQKKFASKIYATAIACVGPSAEYRLEVDPELAALTSSSEESPQKSASKGTSTANVPFVERKASAPSLSSSNKNPAARQSNPFRGRRFADLSTFIKGKSNQLAYIAATQASDEPGALYNPLFIHGGVGIGKTHLLEGFYRRVRQLYPALNVVYLTAEAFGNYFSKALQERSLPGFRQRFRNVDVLIIDDIDFFESKRNFQEELLHTIKHLESHGRQLVFSSDRHPRLLTKMSEELTTRFLSGLVCRIEAPEKELRLEIARQRAHKLKTPITEGALAYVARRFTSNVRELEGAVNCLQTCHLMTGQKVTTSMARQVLADLERDCIRIIKLDDINQIVCSTFGVSEADLKSSRRARNISQPRMLAMFLARKLTQAAYSEIGDYFGGRNHSTVMSAEKQVRKWLESHSSIQVALQEWPTEEIIESLEQQLLAS